MASKRGIAQSMGIFAAVHPGYVVTREMLQAMEVLLEDVPDENLKESMIRLCREVKEIYPGTSLVALIRERMAGDPKANAILAVAKIEEAMRKAGPYKSVVFDDPVIHMIVASEGGWPRICQADVDDEWKYLKKEIEARYEAFNRIGFGMADVPPRLPGLHEAGNSEAGHIATAQIVHIGDPRRIAEWQGKALASGGSSALPGPRGGQFAEAARSYCTAINEVLVKV
jgi:hypothetical protein